jgi:hypothetical protein
VADSSGAIKVSLNFKVTSDNDELVIFYEDSYYNTSRGILIFYALELAIAGIGFVLAISMQVKLAFVECISILIFLPLFVSTFQKVQSTLYTIKSTNMAEPTFGLIYLAIACMPYFVYFCSKLILPYTRYIKNHK